MVSTARDKTDAKRTPGRSDVLASGITRICCGPLDGVASLQHQMASETVVIGGHIYEEFTPVS